MRYLKNEEGLRVLIFLLIVFYAYNFVLVPLGLFRTASLRANDFYSHISRLKKTPPKEIKDIAVVTIGNDSLYARGLRWPWRRSTFADLVNKISSYGPKAIFLDIGFMGQSQESEDDVMLAEAIKKAGNVILAGYINEKDEYVKPLEMFAEAAYGVGLVNQTPDKDLKVRRMRALFPAADNSHTFEYGAAVKILAKAKGIALSRIRYEPHKIILSADSIIPVDKYGLTQINYSAGVFDFTAIPAYKIIDSNAPEDDLSFIKDKLVMVGTTADVTHDIHSTPLGQIPGIYINAVNLLMLLSGSFLKALHFWPAIFIFLPFSLLIGLLSYRLKPAYSLPLLSAIIAGISAGYLYLQIHYNFTMDIFSLLFLCIASYLTVEIYKYVSLIAESERLKIEAILDPFTLIFTQRYFQLNVQNVLRRAGKNPVHFFCLMHINEFEQVKERYPHALPNLIKMLSEISREYMGRGVLIARYGEDALSLCAMNVKKRRLEKSLSLLLAEIAQREFIIDKEALRLSVKIAAVDFPRDNIKSYEDLALSCESMLKRIGRDAALPLAVFDPRVDRVISSSAHSTEEDRGIPKGELGYIRMDLAARNKELEQALDELKKQQKKIEQHYFHTMHSLVRALEEKDPYTAGHSERVGFYATELAKGMNLPAQEIEAVNRAAYLHDIGKIGIPDKILHKNERLTDDEFEFIKRHQASAAKILEGMPFYEQVVPYIIYHHERYDGKGYPHGLSGEMIPVGAQIIAIADAFDAITTGRGYNKPLGMVMDEAIAEMRRSSGTQFNPAYVAKFLELLEQKKIHTLSKTPLQSNA